MAGNKKLKIAIASGKGGVGKSMISSALAMLFNQKGKRVVACDCDVDAPNLAIWLGGEGDWQKKEKISTLEKPEFDWSKCNSCGLCAKNCSFEALKMKGKYHEYNYFLCEGCGVCQMVCPSDVIKMKKVYNGSVNFKKTKYGFDLFSGQLFPGESNSGKIVTAVKTRAEKKDYDIMIIDSAPGTGCPVIASLQGVDFAILVTEPTPSALSDLERVIKTAEHFGILYWIIINKYDINNRLTDQVVKKFDRKVLGKISYDQSVFKAIANLTPIIESDSAVKEEIRKIFNKINKKLL